MRREVEADARRVEDALHAGDQLPVDQCDADRGLPLARHHASRVQDPAGVLVAAIGLVEQLQEVTGRLARLIRRFAGCVPEGAAVVIERDQLVLDGGQAAADIGDRERGPVGKILDGRRPVAGEVAQGDPGERVLAVEVVRVDSRADPVLVRRVGVLALPWTSAADEAIQLQVCISTITR